jgi:hypothetical protein
VAQRSSEVIARPPPCSGRRSWTHLRFQRAPHRRCTGRRWLFKFLVTSGSGRGSGAGCGEAHDGRQRGSQPCNILVECRGCNRPRREVHTLLEHRFERDEHGANEGPNPKKYVTGGPKHAVTPVTAATAITTGTLPGRGHGDPVARGGPCPSERAMKACRVTAVTAGMAITADTARAMRCDFRRSRRSWRSQRGRDGPLTAE